MKFKVESEFANFKPPYPLSEWAKGLSKLRESGGKIVFYQGRRKTNFWYYYLLEKELNSPINN